MEEFCTFESSNAAVVVEVVVVVVVVDVVVLEIGASENSVVRSVLLLFKKLKLSVGFERISANASYIETVCDGDCVIISAISESL